MAPLMLQGMEAPPSNVESRWNRLLAQICQEPFRIFFSARVIHLLGAAICSLAASVIWMIKVIPKVTLAEEE